MKEKLAKEILKLINEYEKTTGAEIIEIRLDRMENTPINSPVMKTCIYKIKFEMR